VSTQDALEKSLKNRGGAMAADPLSDLDGEERAPGATGSLTITIPMDPPRACSPNYRQHWRGRHAATKAFREVAGWKAVQGRMVYLGLTMMDAVILDHPVFSGPVAVAARIAWSKGRKTMDPSNAAGSLKPAIDGLQDARIVANDKQVVSLEVTQDRDKAGRGYVVLEVNALEEHVR
jgi:hypothetical protein